MGFINVIKWINANFGIKFKLEKSRILVHAYQEISIFEIDGCHKKFGSELNDRARVLKFKVASV